MAEPSKVTVVGLLRRPDGTADVGALVRFDRGVALRSGPTPDLIGPGSRAAVADQTGAVSLWVYDPNDPAWSPQGYSLRLTIGWTTGRSTSYDVTLPAGQSTVQLDDLLPLLAGTDGALYAPIGHAHDEYLTQAEGDARYALTGEGGGGGGAVDSVNGKTGAVVLDAGDVGAVTAVAVAAALDDLADGLAPVATSGAYADLTGRPAIPAAYADLTGTVPAAALPAIAVTDYLGPSASQAAMLAKVGQRGDWTTRTDLGTTWVITGDTPTQLASWTELLYPASPVQSVAGRTGAVTLTKADVGLSNVANTAPADLPISTATQAALDTKASASAVTAIDDRLVDVEAAVPVIMVSDGGGGYVPAPAARIYVGTTDPGAVPDGSQWIEPSP